MRVKVKKKHIKAGERDDQWRCPVALALSDVDGVGDVAVINENMCSVWLPSGEHAGYVMLDNLTRRNIMRYDDTGEMKPFNIPVGGGVFGDDPELRNKRGEMWLYVPAKAKGGAKCGKSGKRK